MAQVTWQAAVKDANCDMTAHVDQYPKQISITWNPNKQSEFAANRSFEELVAYNTKSGWAKKLFA